MFRMLNNDAKYTNISITNLNLKTWLILICTLAPRTLFMFNIKGLYKLLETNTSLY